MNQVGNIGRLWYCMRFAEEAKMFRKGHQEEDVLPEERQDVSLRAITPSGWISGKMSIPGLVRVVDYIDKEDVLRLTEVEVEGDSQGSSFLALRRESVIFFIIEGNENLESVESVGHQDEHRVMCWFDGGAVQGVLLTRLGARISDYLARHEGLVVLRECRYRIRNPMTRKVEDGESWAMLLNARAIVAVTERSQTGEE